MSKVNVGDVFTSNSGGTILVMDYKSALEVDILFVETMYETTVKAANLRKGEVKDHLKPCMCGVGYRGDGEYNTRHKSYNSWRAMMERCYSKSYNKKFKTYRDCIVCEEWHNFQTFTKWFIKEYPEDGNTYQLDKDIRVKGNREYGPNTCMFVSPRENTIEANAKHYIFISPEGETFNIYNMSEWCISRKLSKGAMSQVASGKARQHKGWTVAKSV